MRFLTVTHFFEDHGGGIERVAGHLCRHFERLGHYSLWAASGSDSAPADVATIPLACINPTERLTGLPMPVPLPSAIRALAREVHASDAVVVHDGLYATSILALLIAKVSRKPVILIQHIAGIPFASAPLRALMKLANILVTLPMIRAADARVFISDTVRDDLLGGANGMDSELLFNGVDGGIFNLAPRRKGTPEAVSQISLRPRGLRILFVGRYVEKKGLAVIRALAASRSELTFFMIGSGPIKPKDWRLSNVHDLGMQSQKAVAALYRWADMLLLPSVGEGYPLVIQEAMACGLPVICGEPTNRADPDAASWLSGVRVDLADPNASAKRFSSAIDAVDLSRQERAKMSEYALRRYDWRSMARAVIALAEEQLRAAT